LTLSSRTSSTFAFSTVCLRLLAMLISLTR
jgi:hypothetical protein